MMSKFITCGRDCEGCKYAMFMSDGNVIMCAARDKKYYYGQKVPCEDYEEEKK